ncbi:unnamed protein product [Rhodiola kirilowii]
MDDADGGLSFDFEGGLDAASNLPTFSGPVIQSDPGNPAAVGAAAAPNSHAAPPDMQSGPGPGMPGRRSFRQTVCRHWLRSLCMKGDACGFLHQYDKSRMPVCRFFRLYGECREQDCVYKHTNEDIKECNMYKLGFCPNGPDCRYRHVKLPGPPPPVEEVLQKIQQFNNANSNRFFQHRNAGHPQQPQFAQGPNNSNQGSLTRPYMVDAPNTLQQQASQPQQQASQAQLPNGTPNQANRTANQLTQGASRYFIVKSCNRENLELSAQQGVWATQRSNEAKLNEAFDSVENVILVFSVNRTRHFQGCAKMTSKIGGLVGGGNWKYAHGTAHYGRNFSVKWLKLCELSFHKTRHLRNPYNENLPVKISRDCQELEPSVGEQLTSLLYQEPDSELMAISVAAESKREEEKLKGVNPDSASENPDIVPFEDNEEEEEEEEEEESEEEEDESFNPIAQGRGGGRGAMWPPQMAMARGARPFMGMRGFPPMMIGADGFPYGAMPPEGFGMGDPFGAAPRPFPPYGPRFPGDFPGHAPGMMFPPRRPPPGNTFTAGGGYGMMMGPGRGPFMGQGRPGRGPPMFGAPPQNSNWMNKREQQGTGGDRSGGDMENSGGGPEEEARGAKDEQLTVGGGSGSGLFKQDESESEDEAPRRSRHDEGKKKRRGLEGDDITPDH